MTQPEITVHKHSAFVLINEQEAAEQTALRERLLGILDGSIKVGPPLPDPGPHPTWVLLLAAAQDNPLLVKLLQLHEPHAECHPASIDWDCHGEPPSGYEWEYAAWPCETVGIIADHLGVDLPHA